MARKTQVIITDDIDGSEATGTISFGIDGVDYETDLNGEHAQQLRDQLTVWADKARRVGGRHHRGTARGRSQETAKIRQWAKDHGYDVSNRGRLPQLIRDAYNTAH